MNNLTLVFGIVVLALLVFVWSLYNSLVRLRMRVREAWSGIDVQLKRRSDLIPNLVNTVKGYAKHENKVFTAVTEARSALMKATTPQKAAQADNQLTGALKTLFAVAENYPELKANENFQDLQRQLEDTEDKIAYARQFYNSNVLDFNTRIAVFPNVIIARQLGFKEEEFFAADAAERRKVDVNFEE